MGIHGVFKEIGPGERIALSKVSCTHYTKHSRPFRLAIDISIWLFQIQATRGGSNPAIRTFYYRLLRLLSLNIHPLFVFDGPNKPLFKRNKKVGGPGVRVATVPEFLAKQVLKQFGFPWHVAPGEAEAECALLETEGVVDAVLSEDVDTLMFGCGVTLRQWTSEGSTKTPTHVNVYRSAETEKKSGLTKEGMVLVALMSGGDYIPEGIPGCGPKLACDAARAGFGKDLCALRKSDKEGLRAWREKLQHEIRTNESKLFSRRKTAFTISEDFPNMEVLGYYTHPCVSTPAKVAQLRDTLGWDLPIDYPSLRVFTADAFDWRNLGGAKKFIRNLAPALLVRKLRMMAESGTELSPEAQEAAEAELVTAIHGKRNHYTADGELELRISFIPSKLIPIDLSVEPEEDEFLPAGRGDDSDEDMELPQSTPTPGETSESEAPASPSKKRQARPYDPDGPEKLWMLKDFLQLGCPALVEDYEASLRDPKALFKQRRTAKAAGAKGKTAATTRKKKDATGGMAPNALMKHVQVTKAISSESVDRDILQDMTSKANSRPTSSAGLSRLDPQAQNEVSSVSAFKLPSTQIPASLLDKYVPSAASAAPSSSQPTRASRNNASSFAGFMSSQAPTRDLPDVQRTPNRRKRRSPDLSTPRAKAGHERGITAYFSPTPKKAVEVVDLLSSSPVKISEGPREPSPSPPLRRRFVRSSEPDTVSNVDEVQTTAKKVGVQEDLLRPLPSSVTKRRRKGPLRKSVSAPVAGEDSPLFEPAADDGGVDFTDLASPSPLKSRKTTTASSHSPVATGRVINKLSPLSQPESNLGLQSPTGTSVDRTDAVLDLTLAPSSSLPTPPAEEVSKQLHTRSTAAERAPALDQSDQDDDELLDITIMPPPKLSRPLMSSAKPVIQNATVQPPMIAKRQSRRGATPPSSMTTSIPVPEPTFVLPSTTASAVSKQNLKTKKHISLRPSLDGCWKETEVEQLDLTGDAPRGKEKKWRASEVDLLDLTGE